MKRIRVDKVDLRSVKNEEEQRLLAKRMFAVLQPLYGHLADKQDTHFLGLIQDTQASVLRGFFMVDEAGNDVGLTVTRIAETTHAGRTIAHMTLHLGLHPKARGERHTRHFAMREVLRYRLRHPRRPLYIIDTPISAASYSKFYKVTAGLYPTPQRPVPESLWPLCEEIATQRGWRPIAGCPKEARMVDRPMTDAARTDPRPNSPRYQAIQRWFSDVTQDTRGSGMLVIMPVSYWNIALSGLKMIRVSRF